MGLPQGSQAHRFPLKTSLLPATSTVLPSTPMAAKKTPCYSGSRPQDSGRMPYLSQIACPANPKRLPVIQQALLLQQDALLL